MVRFGVVKKMRQSVVNVSLTTLSTRYQTQQGKTPEKLFDQQNNIRLMESQKVVLVQKIAEMKKRIDEMRKRDEYTGNQCDQLEKCEKELGTVNAVIERETKRQVSSHWSNQAVLEKAHIVCTTLTSCYNMMT